MCVCVICAETLKCGVASSSSTTQWNSKKTVTVTYFELTVSHFSIFKRSVQRLVKHFVHLLNVNVVSFSPGYWCEPPHRSTLRYFSLAPNAFELLLGTS